MGTRKTAREDHKESRIESSTDTAWIPGNQSSNYYPSHLRRIRFRDPDTGKNLVFRTNQFTLRAATICALYKSHRQIELFFKWIKQHLRIKAFYGTSENAVKTQIWIAVSIYMRVAIVKKRPDLRGSLHTLLQVLSVTLFEKMFISKAFQQNDHTNPRLITRIPT